MFMLVYTISKFIYFIFGNAKTIDSTKQKQQKTFLSCSKRHKNQWCISAKKDRNETTPEETKKTRHCLFNVSSLIEHNWKEIVLKEKNKRRENRESKYCKCTNSFFYKLLVISFWFDKRFLKFEISKLNFTTLLLFE